MQTDTTDLEKIRQKRRDYDSDLWGKPAKELDNFKTISYGIVGGVFITTILLDISEVTQARLVFGVGLSLFAIYKFWYRSAEKRIKKLVDSSYPHRELYPDSPLYKNNNKA